MLDIALLRDALTDAVDEGYNVASISGGEPFLYPPLKKLLEHARSLGMRTTVTTNGTLLNKRRLQEHAEYIDLLAISLDGPPDSHNRMRGSSNAFQRLKSHLKVLREADIRFGFIFTLTQYNVNELEWVAKFAIEEGASLLQIHPLEEAGRGKISFPKGRPDAIENAHAYILALQIHRLVGDEMRVQVDLIGKSSVSENPSSVYAGPDPYDETMPLSELISPLVIEADGAVVPLQYGFSRDFALGDITKDNLRELSNCWRSDRLDDFHDLCKHVYQTVTLPSSPSFFNWFEEVMRMSHRVPRSSAIDV